MKSKKIIIASFIIVSPFVLKAQTDVDALRYSQTSIAGTARFTSMAGAFGALGGDFSCLAYNPAGIAIYRKSEFTFSPSFYLERTSSSFLGNSTNESRFNFNIPNVGFVFTRNLRKDDEHGWKSWNLGFGLNRINNFQTRSYYEGFNKNNSLLDHFLENANANGGLTSDKLDPYYELLAYKTGVIYDMYDSALGKTVYVKDAQNGITQRRNSTTRGGISEFDFSFGGNYNDVIYLGASLGVSSLRYDEETIYEELDKDNSVPELNKYSFEQDVKTYGAGVNFKMGIIARPTDWLRIGGAFHTPTVYALHDDYKNVMKSDLQTFGSYKEESPAGSYDYTLTTPFKVIGSIGFVIGKMGLIGADYEFTDYSTSRLDATDYSFNDENNLIRSKYSYASNLRLGTEWRYQNLSFRGGYAMYGSPFNASVKTSGADLQKTSITGGVGLRDGNYFLDFAYAYSVSNEYFQPYTLSNQAVSGVKNKIETHNITMTFGVKF